MEWTLILLVIGAAFVVLAIVAIRGSFKSDDAFYGEPPPIPAKPPTVPDASAPTNDEHGDESSDDHGTGGG